MTSNELVQIEELETRIAPSSQVAVVDRKLSTIEELETRNAPSAMAICCD